MSLVLLNLVGPTIVKHFVRLSENDPEMVGIVPWNASQNSIYQYLLILFVLQITNFIVQHELDDHQEHYTRKMLNTFIYFILGCISGLLIITSWENMKFTLDPRHRGLTQYNSIIYNTCISFGFMITLVSNVIIVH